MCNMSLLPAVSTMMAQYYFLLKIERIFQNFLLQTILHCVLLSLMELLLPVFYKFFYPIKIFWFEIIMQLQEHHSPIDPPKFKTECNPSLHQYINQSSEMRNGIGDFGKNLKLGGVFSFHVSTCSGLGKE